MMQDMELGEAIRALMARESINQAELAERAAVSQSTVSRATKGRPLRQGAARARLFRYIQQSGSMASPPPAGAQPVVSAFERIWDGSDAHAAAVAKIIAATEDLRPLV